MPPEVVIGLFESETHRAVASVLADWSRNQLIRDFIVCWTTPDVRFERVSAGETQATRLATELDVITAQQNVLTAQLALLQAKVAYQQAYRNLQLQAGLL